MCACTCVCVNAGGVAIYVQSRESLSDLESKLCGRRARWRPGGRHDKRAEGRPVREYVQVKKRAPDDGLNAEKDNYKEESHGKNLGLKFPRGKF